MQLSRPKGKIFLFIILLAALPLLVWAVLYQRYELRKRAATSEPPVINPNPVLWQTDTVRLAATNFYIKANGQYYWFHPTFATVHSDPGNPTYTTLEVAWPDEPPINGVNRPMRLYIYFRSDGIRWWAYEIRTYDGSEQGEWIYYPGHYFEQTLGQPFTSTVIISHPSGSQDHEIRFDNLYLEAFRNYPPPSITPSPSPSPTPTPTPPLGLMMKFLVRFTGVTNGDADGASGTIRFINGTQDYITPPVTFLHIGGGVYQAQIGINHPMIYPRPGYTIIVKGEKHVARKYCMLGGQTQPCLGTQAITIPLVYPPDSVNFDFTGLPLEPGDLPPQDGVVNGEDFSRLTSFFSKPCANLTDQEKFVGDVDYSGCVNVLDAFLLRKTLETRYDEY